VVAARPPGAPPVTPEGAASEATAPASGEPAEPPATTASASEPAAPVRDEGEPASHG